MSEAMEPEPSLPFEPDLLVCRVCLGTEVRMYHIAEHGLSDMFAQVVGVEINAEDKLPRQLCWECLGRLSSSHHYILKALKTQWLLTNKINESGIITIHDIESIDRAQYKIESTLETKLNTVNEYDFLFTEETVELDNCNANSDSYENVIHIELNPEEEEQLYKIGQFTIDIVCENTEQNLEDVNETALNNYTNAYKGAGIQDEERYTDAKESGDDYGVSDRLQEGRQVDKPSEVCEVINQGHGGSNNNLSLLRNLRSKMETTEEDIDLVICNAEHSSKKAKKKRSSKSISTKMKNVTASEIEIVLEDDVDIVPEISADRADTVKLRKTVVKAAASKKHNINTNTKTARKIDKAFFSGAAYLKKLFICDICDKSYKHKNTLVKHIKRHPKLYYCLYCNYKTYRSTNLKIHVNAIHTKSEVYNCPHCSYITFQKVALSKHVSTKHTKSGVYNCTRCSYTASQKSDLSRHINSKHTKSEVFICPHCNYNSYRRVDLLAHVNAKHTKSVCYDCPHCSYKAFRKFTLTKHINAKHTQSEVFTCQHCSFKSFYKDVITKHLNNQHDQ